MTEYRQEVETPEDEHQKDPWIGRARHMKCFTCMWFVVKNGRVGRCRRHSPAMNGYPVVYDTDWCGDHKLNESA